MTAEPFLDHDTSNKRTNTGVDAGLVDGDDDPLEALLRIRPFRQPRRDSNP